MEQDAVFILFPDGLKVGKAAASSRLRVLAACGTEVHLTCSFSEEGSPQQKPGQIRLLEFCRSTQLRRALRLGTPQCLAFGFRWSHTPCTESQAATALWQEAPVLGRQGARHSRSSYCASPLGVRGGVYRPPGEGPPPPHPATVTGGTGLDKGLTNGGGDRCLEKPGGPLSSSSIVRTPPAHSQSRPAMRNVGPRARHACRLRRTPRRCTAAATRGHRSTLRGPITYVP
eukprot:scaffold346_cov387-Prasinococcus_capsulatus_cf.AAC.21